MENLKTKVRRNFDQLDLVEAIWIREVYAEKNLPRRKRRYAKAKSRF